MRPESNRGSETIAGIPLEMVEGSTSAEKHENLGNMDMAPFMDLLHKKGFFYRSEPGMVIIVPSRFALVTTTTEVAHGLRWQIFGSKKLIQQFLEG
eukprot:4375711-Lingulodinium_polyedra.AAC.1